MTNRLAQESSPYLLQHQNNPVDWYPWGPEALQAAREENKPIFLSIGYSACHWCHVMEHESFENDEIAALMNKYFINIKVDREERPDLDQIYMTAVQMLTGHGGWPMSVFLTPELHPFFGGTYWPRSGRMGMPGFDQILEAVHEAWQQRREQAINQAGRLTEAIQQSSQMAASTDGLPDESLILQAAQALQQNFDARNGGFGTAPKFPHPMDLRLLLRAWSRQPQNAALLEMVEITLDKMARGGLYDQLAGGFHRYSVDEKWLVPHFEKMLYDNALLATCYVEAYQVTGNSQFARVARETIDYILSDMTDEAGGFYSTLDADSEGEEGKYYVWTLAELEQILGADAAKLMSTVYDVTEDGNFEGSNILNLPQPLEQCATQLGLSREELDAQLADAKQKLLAARAERVPPGLDDKVLVSWNGLMIEACALAGGVFAEERYTQAAAQAADFLLKELTDENGRLMHSWRHGQAKLGGYLDDYSHLINGLCTLYESSFEPRWLDEAVRLTEIVLEQFADSEQGGFYYTANDHEQLIARNKEIQDGSVPSSNSMMATALARLAKLTGRDDFHQAAEGTIRQFRGLLERYPTAAGQLLLALDLILGATPEIVIAGKRGDAATREAIAAAQRHFLPRRVLAFTEPGANPPGGTALLAELCRGPAAAEQTPAVFVCENFACQQPALGHEAATAKLAELACQKSH